MFYLKSAFLGFLSAILISNLTYADEIGHVPISLNNDPHTIYTSLGLKPISNSYKLAKLQFLPELENSENGWAGHKIGGEYNRKDCSSYPLPKCPANAKCIKCPVGASYKFDKCKSGYTQSGNTCTKKAEFCVENATTFKNKIPADYTCGKVTQPSGCNLNSVSSNCDKCYSSCYKVNCSGYPLDCKTINKATLHIAETEICSNCKSLYSNCSKQYCKITKCEDGYKLNTTGTACIEKSDTCPSGYYKSCETGTQGTPQYTEKGTACYQCKPKTENTEIDCSTTSSKSAPLGKCPASYGLQVNATTAGKVGCYPCISCNTQKLEDKKISGSTCETVTYNQKPGLQGTCYKCGCPTNTAATEAGCPSGKKLGTFRAATLADGTDCFSCVQTSSGCPEGMVTANETCPDGSKKTSFLAFVTEDGTQCYGCQSSSSSGCPDGLVSKSENCPAGKTKTPMVVYTVPETGTQCYGCQEPSGSGSGSGTSNTNCPATCNNGYIRCTPYTPCSNVELQNGTDCCWKYHGKNKCPSCTNDELCKLYHSGCAFAGYTKKSSSLTTSPSYRNNCYEYSHGSSPEYYWQYSK